MYTVTLNIQHDELIRVEVPSAEAAAAQARAYMRVFVPLKYWRDDTRPGIDITGAAFKDLRGFYLFDVTVWPKLPRPLV